MSELDILCKQFNKKFKEELITVGVKQKQTQKISFTSPMLSYMCYGGIPRGRIIEFAGEENGGKTTTALDIVANAQKLFKKEYEIELNNLSEFTGLSKNEMKVQSEKLKELENKAPLKVVYCDCENTLDDEWARKLGVNTNELIVIKPMAQSAEEIFEMLLQMIETKEVGLVIIDSLGVMLSQQAYEKDMTEKTYGGIALALTLFSKKAEMLCANTNCTLIGINQVRDDMSGFGRLITTGGKGWKHQCSLRLIFKKGDYIDENNNSIKRSSTSPAGNLVDVAIEKTKVFKPDRRNGYYTLKYDTGVDVVSDTVELACFYDIIQKGGSWYSIIDTETGEIMQTDVETLDNEGNTATGLQDLKFQGKPALLEFLRNNENIFDIIYKQVMERLEQ